jgi:hypothetical protein
MPKRKTTKDTPERKYEYSREIKWQYNLRQENGQELLLMWDNYGSHCITIMHFPNGDGTSCPIARLTSDEVFLLSYELPEEVERVEEVLNEGEELITHVQLSGDLSLSLSVSDADALCKALRSAWWELSCRRHDVDDTACDYCDKTSAQPERMQCPLSFYIYTPAAA